MRWSIPIVLLLLWPLSCLARQAADAPREAFDALAGLSAQRVQLADAVAASKRASGKPVEDTARESEQLSSLVGRAGKLGVDPGVARDFFRAQIEANKLVQYRLLLDGDTRGATEADDLGKIRKELDVLNAGMLRLLPQALSMPRGAQCRTRLADAIGRTTALRNLDALHATALVRSFGDFCRNR